MTRQHLEQCFASRPYPHPADALWALVDNDVAKLAEIRAARAAKALIAKSYLDAYDAAADDHERNAVVCCVRLDEPMRAQEYADKVQALKAGTIKMDG